MFDLTGNTALITGASGGIGAAIARTLHQQGASVVLHGTRAERLAELAAELGERAHVVTANLASREEAASLPDRAAEAAGAPVSILVNNAGIASRGQSVVDTDPAEMRRVVATHAFGPHYLASLVLPKMRDLDRGDIIMISSVATRSLGGYGAPYNMGKTAMEALAYTLAKEEREHGIRVNIVAPGLVDTDMGQRLIHAVQGVEDIRTLDQSMPFGRVCQPEDVANVVRFLVSNENSYLTGERLYCDGGGQNLR